ncbi:short-chain collagen C4-like [Octopus sinensis]|uniref:Short-chain collagen C4-like n=1 Tax=Octopus sinensis TaxID=2607531 RepID=A0A7E6FHH0_9MOLL|nr:short-chain collagen C4-like [Octopus sinensis]
MIAPYTPSSLLDLLCCPETVNIVLPSKTKSCDDKPDDTPKPGLGSLYTRWGRTTCPTNSSLVYDGVAGGQHYSHTGGGSNLLCLPNDPIWANYTTEVEKGGYIFGSEYQLQSYDTNTIFSFANAKSLHDHNVPCAVCLTRQPAVVMTLPARTKCYAGWTTEYSGYLMTAHYNHKGRQEYVCVDYAPEADPAGYRNENGATLYFVEAACGSLPCPPYVHGQELTCVVCSKY